MRQSEESASQQSKDSKKHIKSKIIPKIDPIKKIKIKSKKAIYINLSMTQYQVIGDVAEQLGWKIQTNALRGDWDVLWTDSAIDVQTLIKMHYFQKISHFPGIHVIARKNLLGLSLMQMREKFAKHYNFFPLTWMLPSQYHQLRTNFKEDCTYIVKPQAECQGRGIFLTKDLKSVQNGNHYVVQQYISKPYLIDGLKFDFRVYVLLSGTSPMRLYVYDEGLARFATQKYCEPNEKNIKKQFIHLTNYAVNKRNPKYIYNKSAINMGIGHKRSLTSVFKIIERRGENIDELKKKINDIIVKTFIIGLPLVSHQYKFSQPYDEHRNMCFHILGLDIMLDHNCVPYVLEVNHTPSFSTDTPLDYKIKSSLIKDTLLLMNINPNTKMQLVNKAKEKLNGKKQLYQNEQRKNKVKIAQKQRDEYEDKNRGQYTKIYPVDDPQMMELYSKFINEAQSIYFSENNVLRAQMEQEKQQKKKSIPRKQQTNRLQKKDKRDCSGGIFRNNSKKEMVSKIKSFDTSFIYNIKGLFPPTISHIQPQLSKKLPKIQSLRPPPKQTKPCRQINRNMLLGNKQWRDLELPQKIKKDKNKELKLEFSLFENLSMM